MKEKELKPCPFCGEEVELKEDRDYDTDRFIGYYVFNSDRCRDMSKPLCYGCSIEETPFGSKEDTIKAWNTRI